ncbi:MAG TPA: helix-turn-helix domain-containing protein [Caulifigura sp.]|nr:helix-turn-helix domain-containing protein [Caulifigura sp.]
MLHQFDATRSRFAPYGLTCELWRPLPASRPDCHDEIELNFSGRGTITYLLGGQRKVVPPGKLAMFWASIPHQTIGFTGVDFYYVITIPFSTFLQWDFPRSLLTPLMMGEMLIEADCDRTQDDGALLQQWSRDLEHPNPDVNRIVQLEMAARLLRFGLVTAGRPTDSNRAAAACDNVTSLGKAEQMAAFIAHHFHRRLAVSEIAAAASLNPDYASTLFRKTFGTTLTSLITKHRVAEAQRRLLTTDDSVMAIALDSGFDSLTRFNRAFKEIAHMTPREFRKRREWVAGGESGR